METRSDYEKKVAEANDQPARLKKLDKELRAMGIPKPAPGQSMGEVRNRRAKEAYEKKRKEERAEASQPSGILGKVKRMIRGGSFN
jgi:hypothetical protein